MRRATLLYTFKSTNDWLTCTQKEVSKSSIMLHTRTVLLSLTQSLFWYKTEKWKEWFSRLFFANRHICIGPQVNYCTIILHKILLETYLSSKLLYYFLAIKQTENGHYAVTKQVYTWEHVFNFDLDRKHFVSPTLTSVFILLVHMGLHLNLF